MPPRPSSTTVLIIPLILSMLLPPPGTRGAAEIGYYAADQPSGNLSYNGLPSGYLASLSFPIQENIVSLFSVSNITASSLCLLSPATFPSCGNPPTRHGGHGALKTSSPWPIAPRAAQLVYSRKILSSDGYGSSDGNSVLFPEPTYDLCTSYRFGSLQSLDPWVRVQLIASWNEYYKRKPDIYSSLFSHDELVDDDAVHRRKASSRISPPKSAGTGRSRKMLRGNDSTTEEDLHPRIFGRQRQALDPKQRTLATIAAAGLASLGLLLCSIAGVLLWCKRNKKSNETEEPGIHRTELCPWAPRRYSHRELAAATQGFADEAKIGRGGFGPVYRGYLGCDNRHVAIKVLSPHGSSVQGAKEFEAEVRVMTRLRHRNVVDLVGWCDDGHRGLLLVYEFVPNGSLDRHLHDPQRVLSWSDRYKIALGVGSAILYLHTECDQCVVHGDIKPANIMLDASFNAKLGDFGLARFIAHDETDQRTTQFVAGTLGYIDPEFVNTRRPSAESDVYSFGVVLLEMACGRRPTSAQQSNGTASALVNWVRGMYLRDSILGAADRRLDGEFNERQMKCVLVAGLWCTNQVQSQRPSIAQAVGVLRREDAELPAPVGPEMRSPDAVRSLEERAYGDFPAETEYHTSEETTRLLSRE